jgi:transposase
LGRGMVKYSKCIIFVEYDLQQLIMVTPFLLKLSRVIVYLKEYKHVINTVEYNWSYSKAYIYLNETLI